MKFKFFLIAWILVCSVTAKAPFPEYHLGQTETGDDVKDWMLQTITKHFSDYTIPERLKNSVNLITTFLINTIHPDEIQTRHKKTDKWDPGLRFGTYGVMHFSGYWGKRYKTTYVGIDQYDPSNFAAWFMMNFINRQFFGYRVDAEGQRRRWEETPDVVTERMLEDRLVKEWWKDTEQEKVRKTQLRKRIQQAQRDVQEYIDYYDLNTLIATLNEANVDNITKISKIVQNMKQSVAIKLANMKTLKELHDKNIDLTTELLKGIDVMEGHANLGFYNMKIVSEMTREIQLPTKLKSQRLCKDAESLAKKMMQVKNGQNKYTKRVNDVSDQKVTDFFYDESPYFDQLVRQLEPYWLNTTKSKPRLAVLDDDGKVVDLNLANNLQIWIDELQEASTGLEALAKLIEEIKEEIEAKAPAQKVTQKFGLRKHSSQDWNYNMTWKYYTIEA